MITTYLLTGSYHPVRLFVVLSTYACKLLQQRYGIEGSYITVPSYPPRTHVTTEISYSYCDISVYISMYGVISNNDYYNNYYNYILCSYMHPVFNV